MTRPAIDALTAEFRRLKRLGDGDAWQTLSIARGESAAFKCAVAEGRRSQLS